MALLAGLGAMAIRLTAFAKAIRQASRTQITEIRYLRFDTLPLD